MRQLWTPAGAVRPRCPLPEGDKTLPDGRRLMCQGPFQLQGNPDVPARLWLCRDGLRVIASLDPTPHGRLLHVSLSYADRDPDWATIKAVREAMYPDTVDVMMVLPRVEDYVDIHEHAFHLNETPVAWGVQ